MLQEYSVRLHELIKDVTLNIPELSYIEAEHVAIGLKRSRESSVEEVWAEVYALD